MANYASNCPISRPIKLKNVVPTIDFNGILWSPQVGWMFDPQDDMDPIETPPPGADG